MGGWGYDGWVEDRRGGWCWVLGEEQRDSTPDHDSTHFYLNLCMRTVTLSHWVWVDMCMCDDVMIGLVWLASPYSCSHYLCGGEEVGSGKICGCHTSQKKCLVICA